jgi:ankyrin repeat protein
MTIRIKHLAFCLALSFFLSIFVSPLQGQFGERNPEHWFRAARQGNLQVIESFLEDRFPVNKTDSDGWTALHLAARNGHNDVIDRLLEAGADLYKTDDDDQTALMHAAKTESQSSVNRLIEAANGGPRHRGNLNQALINTLLSEASTKAVLERLIQAGADVHPSSTRDDPPLLIAVREGKNDMVELLLNNGADPEVAGRKNGHTPLFLAILHSVDFKSVPIDADNGTGGSDGFGSDDRTNENGGGGFPDDGSGGFGSSQSGEDNNGGGFGSGGFTETKPVAKKQPAYQQIAELLIESGADVNRITSGGRQIAVPLFQAVRIGNVELVRRLLKAGANPYKTRAANLYDEFATRPHAKHVRVSEQDQRKIRIGVPDTDRKRIDQLLDEAFQQRKESFFETHGTMAEDPTLALIRSQVEPGDPPLHDLPVHQLLTMGDRALGRPESYDLMEHKFMQVLLHRRIGNIVPENWFTSAIHGNLNNMRRLRGGWECLNARDLHWDTALHHAARHGRPRIVRYLLDAGARADLKNISGHTPLNLAILMNHRETAAVLRNAGAPVHEHTNPPLIHEVLDRVIETGQGRMVDLLLRSDLQHPNMPWDDETPLTRFIHQKPLGTKLVRDGDHNVNVDVLEKLIRSGADVNAETAYGYTALDLSIRYGGWSVFQTLLEHGARVDDPRSLTMDAIQHERPKVAAYIIDREPDVNWTEDGTELVFSAVYHDQVDVVKKLDRAGVHLHREFEERDVHEATPLFAAAEDGASDVLSYLIDSGADVSRTDEEGETALFKAARNGYPEIAEKLIRAGADVHHANQDGETALMVAARRGHMNMVQFLLNNGADVDHQSNDGNTALIHASKGEHPQVVQRLIASGAPVNVKNQNNETALTYALRDSSIRMTRILLRAGARLGPDRASKRKMYRLARGTKNQQLARLVESHLIDRILDHSFEEPDRDTRDRIRKQIKKLSETDLETRKQATNALISAGIPAIPLLKSSRNQDHPAVKYRVEYILDEIVRTRILKKDQ